MCAHIIHPPTHATSWARRGGESRGEKRGESGREIVATRPRDRSSLSMPRTLPPQALPSSPVRVRSLQHTGHGRDCCPQPPLFQQALLGAEDRGGLLIHFSRARESPRTEGEKRRGKGASAAWKKVLWPRGRDRLSVQPKGRECFPPFPPSMQWPLMIALWVIFSTIEKKRTL